jgi:hypothetical protein
MRAPTLASSPHRPDLPVPPSLPNSAISGRIGSCEEVEVHPGENWFALPSPPPPPPSCRSAVPPPFLSSLPCLTRRPLLRRVPASSPRSVSREPDSPVPPSPSLSRILVPVVVFGPASVVEICPGENWFLSVLVVSDLAWLD